MNTQNYVSFRRGNRRKLKRLITGIAIIAAIVFAAMFIIGKLTANSDRYQQKVTLVEENRALREELDLLNERIAELEAAAQSQTAPQPEATDVTPSPAQPTDQTPPAAGGFTADTPRDTPGQ